MEETRTEIKKKKNYTNIPGVYQIIRYTGKDILINRCICLQNVSKDNNQYTSLKYCLLFSFSETIRSNKVFSNLKNIR